MGDQGVTSKAMPGLFTLSPTWDHDPVRDARSTCILLRIPEERPQPKKVRQRQESPQRPPPGRNQVQPWRRSVQAPGTHLPPRSKAEASDWWRAGR